MVSTAFGAPLVATVKDSGGNPVSGVVVTVYASGDGSECHIRRGSEYGNDERKRRGHLGGSHSEWDGGRALHGDSDSFRSSDGG